MKNYKDYSNLNRSRYALKIPYNGNAKALIFGLRKFGKLFDFKVRVRGSGSRAPQFRADGKDLRRYDQSLPLELAETVRIYITQH